ncbi:unnamed protein product [Mytilus coruscus]|uniref:C2H2-type domain-containing protein n=1 Tax=Mytilus coruscus TaxID=42192 RepID=A0A6J8CY26_MYTCO|nr:unnamed protein product [Mytilus coruscus]
MIVSGPTSCGKTHFMKNVLQQIGRLCSPSPERIVWLYRRWQPLYEEIQRTVLPRVEFIRGIPFDLEREDFFDPNIRNMILLDDLMSKSAKDSRINLFTEGNWKPIACWECGVVFAHIRGLEAHSQQGCGKKNVIALPMTGKNVEDALSGFAVTVCCADDLPSYVSDRPRTLVVNTDNCDQKGSHSVAFHFPASGPPEFVDSLGRLPETYQRYFRNVLIVDGPQYCVVSNQIQPDDSDTCGLYCIYYMYVKLRCRGLMMKDIINNFSSTDLTKNDSKLVAIFG